MAGDGFRLEQHGSITLVRPLTDEATQWLVEHTDGSWFGNALAVEPRYIPNLVEGMIEFGFEVAA